MSELSHSRDGDTPLYDSTGDEDDSYDLDYLDWHEGDDNQEDSEDGDDEDGDAADIYAEVDGIEDFLYEIDEDLEREDLPDQILVENKISREDRARQEALKVAMEYGWDDEGYSLLVEVFGKHGWSTAKEAMCRELDNGLTKEELKLALLTRELWEEYGEFGINPRGYNYPYLSWPKALDIIRAFSRLPDFIEIEQFLIEAYANWRRAYYSKGCFYTFWSFMDQQLNVYKHRDCSSPNVVLENYWHWSEYDKLPPTAAIAIDRIPPYSRRR